MTDRFLRDLTTLRVGGPAARMVDAVSAFDAVAAIRAADAVGTPVLVLGGGSNLLVSDAGFDGTVLRLTSSASHASVSRDRVTLIVDAGAEWDALVAEAVANGWAGLEALSGIPGRVGATPIQNVGAYGIEVGHVIERVTVFDRVECRLRDLSPRECDFGYRASALKRADGRYLVLTVTFSLAVSPVAPAPAYADVLARLGVPAGTPVSIADIRAAVLEVRASKGMVLDDADHDTWSAGSFFVNPVIDSSALPAGAPRWDQPDGRVKTSAAWLIEHAGFARGWAPSPGFPASLSTKHALAITNRGAATAADLLVVARAVRDGVRDRFGIELEPEARLVGCSIY